MAKHKDLTDMRFGRLVVLKEAGKTAPGEYNWLCQCDCGNIVVKSGRTLAHGDTKSYGCLRKEILVERNYKNRKYNIKNDRVYRIWRAMNHRCYNENDEHYKNYGELGVVVCEEWKDDFEIFQEWALNNGYEDNLTIDRINYKGNYCPEKCS